MGIAARDSHVLVILLSRCKLRHFKKVTFYIMTFGNVNRLCALTVFMSHCCLAFRWMAASRGGRINERIALVGVQNKVKGTELTDLRHPTLS